MEHGHHDGRATPNGAVGLSRVVLTAVLWVLKITKWQCKLVMAVGLGKAAVDGHDEWTMM